MEEKLKVGDCVVSNKYGTLMTVVCVKSDSVKSVPKDQVLCAWFNEKSEPFEEAFFPSDLTMADQGRFYVSHAAFLKAVADNVSVGM